MFTRISLLIIALLASSGAFALEPEDIVIEAGGVRQLAATQAHLRASNPPDDVPRKASAPLVARLVGKMLSAHVKGLNIELSSEPESAAPAALQSQQGALRLNRRAEICYENYRLGIKRGGLAMRYEMAF